MDERYQRRWDIHMMPDYCWSLKRNVPDLNHSRKSWKRKFLPSRFDFIWLQGLCLFDNTVFLFNVIILYPLSSKEKEICIKCSFSFWSLSFSIHRTQHCDAEEIPFEENHNHLGQKLRYTLPLIEDIAQRLQINRSTISETTNAITHLLDCNSKKITVNLEVSQNLVILQKNILTCGIKFFAFLESLQKSDLKKDVRCKTNLGTLNFVDLYYKSPVLAIKSIY